MKKVSKKVFAILAISVLALSLFALSACGDKDKPADPVYTVGISGIGVANGAVSIEEGKTLQLSALIKRDGAADSSLTVTWSSDTTANATVSASGLVTAVKAGTAKITATYKDVSASVTVTVTEAVPVGREATLAGTGHVFSNDPADPTNQEKWSYPEAIVTLYVNLDTNIAVFRISMDVGGGALVDFVGDGDSGAIMTALNIGKGAITEGTTEGTYKATFQMTVGENTVPYVIDFAVDASGVYTATIDFPGMLTDAEGNPATVAITSAAA